MSTGRLRISDNPPNRLVGWFVLKVHICTLVEIVSTLTSSLVVLPDPTTPHYGYTMVVEYIPGVRSKDSYGGPC